MSARALAALILFCGLAAGPAATREPLKSGLDLSTLDRSVRPQDDLYRFANGGWLDRTSIPPDRVSYGTFIELGERAELDLRRIIENLQGRNHTERQIRDLYSSVLDEATVERRGIVAVQPQLRRIDAIDSVKKLAEECGRLSSIGAGGPFSASAGVDAHRGGQIVVQVTQGGTLLPDRGYYLKTDPQSVAIRQAYVEYVATILRLTGRPDAEGTARAVLNLEVELARAQDSQSDTRVALSDDAAFTLRSLHDAMPGFDWTAWGKPQGFDNAARIVLGQPAFFKAFAERAQSTPLSTWKAWLAVRYLTASAPYVNKALHDERFEFFGRLLTGQQAPRARWKQGVAHVNLHLGDALGRLYVDAHFSTQSRRRVKELVDNMLEAYRQAVRQADWMSPGTRQLALDKLASMKVRIGYPDSWRSYSQLEIRADDLLGNVQRAQKFENDYRMLRLTRPAEPDQWLITPQTVNATYLSWRNEMLLPAAILQPPLFDPDAEDAVNYGGIGALIGHEIGHGFDQRGRRFDANGAPRDWWSPRDEEEFNRRAVGLVQQFNAYTALPGAAVNGVATLGENIGDLGGLAIAVRAYRISLKQQTAPAIDGFTGEQRLFLRWAQVWRTVIRDEYLRQTLLIDQHAPPRYRANGTVVNLDAFHAAFNVQPGDKLYLAPERRVRIW
jgi:putative endopeptidase